MKRKKENYLGRVLALFLAALITVTSVDVSAFAATKGAGDGIEYQQHLSVELEQQVQDAYKVLLKAYRTGDKADFVSACKLIAKLSPTQCVRLFVLKYGNYYKLNYLKDDFAYFNVDKYLLAHPELVDSKYPVNYNREKALEHYLEYGIYRGESSCTDFDPVVAIIVQPAECVKAIVNDNKISSDGLVKLREAYATAEGSIDTLAYDLSSTFNKPVNNKFIADDGILFIAKKAVEPSINDIKNAITAGSEDDYVITPALTMPEEPASSVTPSENTDYIPPVNEERDPFLDGGFGGPGDLINFKARNNVLGYKLFTSPAKIASLNDDGDLRVENGKIVNFDLSFNKNDNYRYNITYVADNYLNIANKGATEVDYAKVKDNAKYTVMVYLCGTDLESDGEYQATGVIADMLKSKYDTNKVNVLVCAGGTSKWKPGEPGTTGVLEENNGVKCSIYYLNPATVTSTAANADSNTVITNDSLIKLTEIDTPIEMGQSELLLGFMDMAYELFPADNFWLSLWNHGGGAKSGICFSDTPEDNNPEIKANGLTLARIEEALAASQLHAANRKLSVLSFDACMMGGVEEAYNFSCYSDYMIGSAESSVGDIDYAQALKYINSLGQDATVDNKEVAKKAAEGYITPKKDFVSISPYTESSFDLSKMDGINKQNEELSLCLEALLRDSTSTADAYSMIKKASVRSKSYGASDTSASWGYLDYYDFLTKLEAYLKDLKANTSSGVTKNTCQQAITNIETILDTKFILSSDVSYAKENDIIAAPVGGEALSLKNIAVTRAGKNLIYNKVFDNYLSGMSIYFPINDNSYQAYTKGETGDLRTDGMKNYIGEGVLHHYSFMLAKMSETSNSAAELERLKKVATALASTENTDATFASNRGMIDYVGTTTYVSGKDSSGNDTVETVITVNFKKDYSQTAYANDGVHKDPFTDFVDTVKDVTLLALKNTTLVNKDSQKTNLNYDVVVAYQDVQTAIATSSLVTYDEKNGLFDSASLNFDLGANSLMGYVAEGLTAWSTDNKYQDWAHVISKSDKEKYAIDYASIGKADSQNDVYIFDGKYYVGTTENSVGEPTDALLAFSKNQDTTNGVSYSYLGALSKDANGSYTNVTNVTGVSFNHYVVSNDGEISILENIVNAMNEGKSEDETVFIYNPVFIIDSSNVPVIKEQLVAGVGYLESNSKVAVEVNVIVPEIKNGVTEYPEKHVVLTGNSEVYLNPYSYNDEGEVKEKYKGAEALGQECLAETPAVASDGQEGSGTSKPMSSKSATEGQTEANAADESGSQIDEATSDDTESEATADVAEEVADDSEKTLTEETTTEVAVEEAASENPAEVVVEEVATEESVEVIPEEAATEDPEEAITEDHDDMTPVNASEIAVPASAVDEQVEVIIKEDAILSDDEDEEEKEEA